MARKKTKKRSGRAVTVKGHYRSPRGPNKGKPRVFVPGHKRRKPKDSR